MIEPKALAREIAGAYAGRRLTTTPSSREGGLDLVTAYAVERELVHLRQAEGHRTTGRKVGFANKAMWRVLKLDTLVWAHMYDNTVHHAPSNEYTVPVGAMIAPRIEPEIVFRLKQPLDGAADADAVLARVDRIALGFEIIDCVYPDWKFAPVDFVAAYGLHAGLIVGAPLAVTATGIPSLVEQLASFTVTLQKNGAVVATGAGRNSLKSPALCLGELGAAITKQGAEPLAAGEYVSSGTLTDAQPIAAGDSLTASVEGIGLPPLTARID